MISAAFARWNNYQFGSLFFELSLKAICDSSIRLRSRVSGSLFLNFDLHDEMGSTTLSICSCRTGRSFIMSDSHEFYKVLNSEYSMLCKS